MNDKHEGPEEGGDGHVQRNFAALMEHMRAPGTAESIGGNAFRRTVDGVTYSCFAINGVINSHTMDVREYGNYTFDIGEDEETFSLVFGVPPPELLLAGQSDRLLDARSGDVNGTLPTHCHDALMAMRPLFDVHAREATARAIQNMHVTPTSSWSIQRAVRDMFKALFGS